MYFCTCSQFIKNTLKFCHFRTLKLPALEQSVKKVLTRSKKELLDDNPEILAEDLGEDDKTTGTQKDEQIADLQQELNVAYESKEKAIQDLKKKAKSNEDKKDKKISSLQEQIKKLQSEKKQLVKDLKCRDAQVNVTRVDMTPPTKGSKKNTKVDPSHDIVAEFKAHPGYMTLSQEIAFKDAEDALDETIFYPLQLKVEDRIIRLQAIIDILQKELPKRGLPVPRKVITSKA